MQIFFRSRLQIIAQTVEVDAENEKIQKNQFVFKATYGVAQKRLISKRQKKRQKNYYKKEKYSCFLLSCFANLQWCCGCNRTKSNIGHYFFIVSMVVSLALICGELAEWLEPISSSKW